jgi:D-amino-acid oxidase
MNRRLLLRNANMAAVSLAAGGGLLECVRRPVNAVIVPGMLAVNLPETACRLPKVRVSAEREIRTVVGLRPYRPSGFRVAKEMVGETAVVHNYGHGGGGITLSWGTSKLAVDLGLPGHVGPVAVLGCGAVGLATARLAQEAGFDVTIYTKAMPPETTSNIAGGQWLPVSVYDPAKTFDAGVYAAVFGCSRIWVPTISDYDGSQVWDSLDEELHFVGYAVANVYQ